MDVTLITQLVGSLGFPIVCCGYMMVTNNQTIKQLTEAVNSLTSAIGVLIHDRDLDNEVHIDGLSYTAPERVDSK